MPTKYDLDAAYRDWIQFDPRLSWQEIAEKHGFTSRSSASNLVHRYHETIVKRTNQLPPPIRSFVESFDHRIWGVAKTRLITTLINNPQWCDVEKLRSATACGALLRNPNVGRVTYVMVRFTFGLPSISTRMDDEYKQIESLGLKPIASTEASP